jgi:catechol 2,3-dioxygenase-like lactoylglutathione lyase family enzyme
MYLEHANLTVNDLDASIAFYCEIFDWKIRWEGHGTSNEGLVRAAHVGNDRFYLALFEAEQPGPVVGDYAVPGVNHVGFVVDDLEATRSRIRALGVKAHLEFDYEPGHRFYVFDPSGIEIELIEYDA